MSKLPHCSLALGLVFAACGADPSSPDVQDKSAVVCSCPIDWQVDNLAVCVSGHTAFTSTLVYSSYLNEYGDVTCDAARPFPQPLPKNAWSAHRIASACAGSGKLTLRVRPGRAETASADDCVLGEVSVDFDYVVPDAPLDLPVLTSWSAQDQPCARAYEDQGGYLEFVVESEQLGCGETGTSVQRVDICPVRCDGHPNDPGCDVCGGPQLATRF